MTTIFITFAALFAGIILSYKIHYQKKTTAISTIIKKMKTGDYLNNNEAIHWQRVRSKFMNNQYKKFHHMATKQGCAEIYETIVRIKNCSEPYDYEVAYEETLLHKKGH